SSSGAIDACGGAQRAAGAGEAGAKRMPPAAAGGLESVSTGGGGPGATAPLTLPSSCSNSTGLFDASGVAMIAAWRPGGIGKLPANDKDAPNPSGVSVKLLSVTVVTG